MKTWVISAALTRWEEVLLPGPVVAGAVILPKDCKILYLNDSKQLSAKKEKSCMM